MNVIQQKEHQPIINVTSEVIVMKADALPLKQSEKLTTTSVFIC